MLREYVWRGTTWQFDDRDAPEGAVPVDGRKPKGRPAKTKERAPAADKGRGAQRGDD